MPDTSDTRHWLLQGDRGRLSVYQDEQARENSGGTQGYVVLEWAGSSRNRKINKMNIDVNSPHHLSHRKNYYSQNGEDGVIDFLFERL